MRIRILSWFAATLIFAAEGGENQRSLRERISRGEVNAVSEEDQTLLTQREKIREQQNQLASLEATCESLVRDFAKRIDPGPDIRIRKENGQIIAQACLVSWEGHIVTIARWTHLQSEVNCEILQHQEFGSPVRKILQASVLTTSWKDGITLLKLNKLDVDRLGLRPELEWNEADLGDLVWSRGRIGNISVAKMGVPQSTDQPKREKIEQVSEGFGVRLTPRRDGFISVMECSLPIAIHEVGSPIYNLYGDFVGMMLARSSVHGSFILPVERIRSVLETNSVTPP